MSRLFCDHPGSPGAVCCAKSFPGSIRKRRTTAASTNEPPNCRAAFFRVLVAVAAQRPESCGSREKMAAHGAYRCIWGFIFPFGVRRKMLARGETDTPKPTATGSVTLMLEINQESNAGRINSGSTAKSLKTQV